MKIRAIANGDVIEANEDAANQLIDAGIYEAADEKKTEKVEKKTEKKEEKKEPVAPMTTEDFPQQVKPRKQLR